MQRPATRFDIFTFSHKALRAFLSHVLLDVGRTDWRDAEDRANALGSVKELLGVCHIHLEQENQFVHPAMEAREPGSARHIVEEHVGQMFAIDALFGLCDAVEGAGYAERLGAGQRLYRELAVFVADNFEHMAFEESEHNRVLWTCFNDEELRALQQRMVNALSPERTMTLMNWMLPHLNPAERAEVLQGLRSFAQPEIFRRVVGNLRGQIPTKDWGKLSTALGAL